MEEKQRELEAIQQMQVELELAKAKAQLEAQQRELAEIQAKLRQPPQTAAVAPVIPAAETVAPSVIAPVPEVAFAIQSWLP